MAEEAFVSLGDTDLEYRWVGECVAGGHALVFLHEGLGSVALWGNFPESVAEASGTRGLVYSREGHGQSSTGRSPRNADFMHREAREVLPRLLDELGIERPVFVGHSDGASIALIHAAEYLVSRLVLLGPHVFVEEESLKGIRTARETYLSGYLSWRMAKYHRDPDATFWGWNDVWLSEEFRDWTIEDCLARIECPVLVIQGREDEYGTLAQVEAIKQGVRGRVETTVLDACRHAPQLQRPEETLKEVVRFVKKLSTP